MLLFKLQFSALKIEKESCQHICYGLRWNPLEMSSQWLGDNSIHILRNFPNFSEITFYFQVNLLSSWRCWINESRILYKDVLKDVALLFNTFHIATSKSLAATYMLQKKIAFYVKIRPPNYRVTNQPLLSGALTTTAEGHFSSKSSAEEDRVCSGQGGGAPVREQSRGAPVREQSNIQPHWADTNHGRVARGR